MKNYLIIIEKVNNNYSAYLPDVPGCVATGKTLSEVKRRIRKALQYHIIGLQEDGLPIPKPAAVADYVVIAQ